MSSLSCDSWRYQDHSYKPPMPSNNNKEKVTVLYNDPIHRYVPLQWQIVHPKLMKEAKKAYDRKAIELQEKDGHWYWRRAIDLKEMTLGL